MDKSWFKERLSALGRTQADLARHLGLDASAISRLLKGERQMKGAEAVAIASFLQASPEDVLKALGNNGPPWPMVPPSFAPPSFAPPSPAPPPADDGFIADPRTVPAQAEMPRNLPVHGAAIGGVDGSFEWNGEIHEYVERPPQLQGVRNAYAVYVTGDSMHPMFQPGWVLHINPNRPVTPGCGVVVQIRPNAEYDSPLCYIKEFVRRTGSKLLLRQYNPACEIEWPLERVIAIHRIVGIADM